MHMHNAACAVVCHCHVLSLLSSNGLQAVKTVFNIPLNTQQRKLLINSVHHQCNISRNLHLTKLSISHIKAASKNSLI